MRKLGTLIGAAGGIVFGLLFAPKSGKEFRKQLAKTENGKKIAQLFTNSIIDAGKESVSQAQKWLDHPEVQKFIKDKQKKLNDLEKEIREEAKKFYNDTKKKLEKEGKNVKKAIKKETKNVKKTVKKVKKDAVKRGKNIKKTVSKKITK